jgi:hypothetical protein
VRDQISHPYKTTGKIIVSYVLIFMILERSQENKTKNVKGMVVSIPEFNLLLISS